MACGGSKIQTEWAYDEDTDEDYEVYYAFDLNMVPTGNDAGKPQPTEFNKPIIIEIFIRFCRTNGFLK